MYRLFLSLCLLASTVMAEEDPFARILYERFDNGLQVYLLSDDKAEKSGFHLSVGVGWEVETEQTYGLSHLTEHLIFRDQRIPKRDYLNHFEDLGATYFNGFTDRFSTDYYLQIDGNRSYEAAAMLHTMIFDKNVTEADLIIEKGAVRNEIGEPAWGDVLADGLTALSTTINALGPPEHDVYRDDFAMAEEDPAISNAQERANLEGLDFTRVMKHYDTYYYPANMTLMITGPFDMARMRAQLRQTFGAVEKTGTATAAVPDVSAQINAQPFRVAQVSRDRTNTGFIGAKYLHRDYARGLIIEAYMENLAERMQVQLRNFKGETYSVDTYFANYYDAGIAAVSFDGLHRDFGRNAKMIRRQIALDRDTLDDAVIADALRKLSRARFEALEHDVDTLMGLIDTMRYLREDLGITDKTPPQILRAISPEQFRDVIRELLQPERRYEFFYVDYALFPYDIDLLGLLFYITIIILYIKIGRLQLLDLGYRYAPYDVIAADRLGSRFFSLLIFIVALLLSVIAAAWLEHLVLDTVTGIPFATQTLQNGGLFAHMIVYLILIYVLFYGILRTVFGGYAYRVELAGEHLAVFGFHSRVFTRAMIASAEVTRDAPLYATTTFGVALLFRRPVVRLTLHDGTVRRLRCHHPKPFAQKINVWLHS